MHFRRSRAWTLSAVLVLCLCAASRPSDARPAHGGRAAKGARRPPRMSRTPPATRTTDSADVIFGTRVADPYRWLEDEKSAEVQGWMYGSGFTDLDGHRWNLLHMDMSRLPKS